jgi:hypothetical protein
MWREKFLRAGTPMPMANLVNVTGTERIGPKRLALYLCFRIEHPQVQCNPELDSIRMKELFYSLSWGLLF